MLAGRQRRLAGCWQDAAAAAATAVVVLAVCCLQAATAASLPEGLDSKPLIDQLLARKAFWREHMQSDEWKQHIQQQHDARSGPHNQQGVLIVAGGRDMFANAAITIRVLRSHIRSSIPVEIVHYGPKELPAAEILSFIKSFNSTQADDASGPTGSSSSSSSSSSTAGSGVSSSSAASGPVFITDGLAAAPPEVVAALHRKLPEGIKGFPAKVYALTHVTRFRQVLLLDADSMPLVDPNLLFNVPMFQRTGSMFWPDLWHNAWVNDTIYTLVGDMSEPPWVKSKHHRLVDSGQILFDRVKHAQVLEYLWLLNSHHEWVYKHMHGDKDTFLLAFSMAGRREQFTQVPCFVRDAMRDIPGHEHKFHHLGMVQSMQPGMLAAALKAARTKARQAASSSSSSSSSRSSIDRRLLQQQSVSAATLQTAAENAAAVSAGLPGSTAAAADAAGGLKLLLTSWLLWWSAGDLLPNALRDSSSSSRSLWQQHWSHRRRLQQPGREGGGGDDAGGEEEEGFDDEEDDLGKSAAAAAGAGAGAAGAITGTGTGDSGAASSSGSSKKAGIAARSRRPNWRHVGVPVFFHRTSFNSKFFPDCLSADKIKTGYCEVEWVSVPLSSEQAGHSLKPHMFAWNDNQIDTRFYQQHCTSNGTHRRDFSKSLLLASSSGQGSQNPSSSTSSNISSSAATQVARRLLQQQQQTFAPAVAPGPRLPDSSLDSSSSSSSGHQRSSRRAKRRPVADQFGLPPEHNCDKLPVGDDVIPIPVVRVQMFPYMLRVLRASYDAFKEVREKAGVKE